MKPLRRIAAAAALVALSTTSLAACGGGDDKESPSANTSADTDDSGDASPEEVMAFAKAKLDETSGVRLSLSTDDTPRRRRLPAQRRAATITDAPAFDGTASGRFLNSEQNDVGVRSVDGDFYVNVPILGWQTFDPTALCAPDPATLLDPDKGVGHVLTVAERPHRGRADPERGRQQRRRHALHRHGRRRGDQEHPARARPGDVVRPDPHR